MPQALPIAEQYIRTGQRPGGAPRAPKARHMCGRYSLADVERENLGERFLLTLEALGAIDVRPRYNIAPSQQLLAVVVGEDGWRTPTRLRWGFTPSWSKDGKPGPINARAETAADKPMFRSAVGRSRALVLADGFFEWRRNPTGPKSPMRFRCPSNLAAMWIGRPPLTASVAKMRRKCGARTPPARRPDRAG